MGNALSDKADMRRWLDAWQVAAHEMDEAKTLELRTLTEEDAARCFDSLSWPRESLWFSPERLGSEGLIEQQRLFQRLIQRDEKH